MTFASAFPVKWRNPAPNWNGSCQTSRWSTAMKPAIGPTKKDAGFGLWWPPASSFKRSRFREELRCWSNCSGRRSRDPLCSDRCPSCLKYHKGSRQFCWANFKLNVPGALEIAKTTNAEKFCRDLLALHARLFGLWHRFRDGPSARYGPIDRQQLILKSIPLEQKFFDLADRYAGSDDKDVRNPANALLTRFERFFTFPGKEGVEPTNNSAERALRCAVQWRKISFGSRSAEGEVAVAGLLTIARTCQMQGHKRSRTPAMRSSLKTCSKNVPLCGSRTRKLTQGCVRGHSHLVVIDQISYRDAEAARCPGPSIADYEFSSHGGDRPTNEFRPVECPN